MSVEIRYNPAHFAPVEAWTPGGQKQVVEQQAAWIQIDQDRWVEATIDRAPAAFQGRVYLRKVVIRNEQQPDGSWRVSRATNPTQFALVEDATAPRSSAPVPPKPAQNAATAYINRNYSKEIPKGSDIHAIRRKPRMY